MSFTLHLKPENNSIREMYIGHSVAFNGDSGTDLYFKEDQIIPAKSTVLIDLGIACEMRELNSKFTIDNMQLFTNKSYFILPRSSIYKTPLRQSNSIGLIDSKYFHNLKVAVDNISDKDYKITKGQKLFQIALPSLQEFTIAIVNELSSSSRGIGFGSSDNKVTKK